MSSPSPFRSRALRCLTTLAVCCLPFLLGGWLYGPQSTFDTKGPVAKAQLEVFYVTVWVTGVIFVIVASVLAYATLKFKARSEADEHAAPPPQGHGNPLVELSLIGASVIALVFIAIPTLRAIWYTDDVPEAEKANAYDINATGLQWWFRFEYASEEISLPGNTGKIKLSTANELVIPVGRPIRIHLRTTDVIHSFWVPKLAGKVDMMPNRANRLWLQADEPGYYWGQCAEFCGESHAVMRFRVIALTPADFAKWIENQKSAARETAPAQPQAQFASYQLPGKTTRNTKGYSDAFDANPLKTWADLQTPSTNQDPVLVTQGRQLFKSKTCTSCHTVRGHDGAGTTAPDLTHIGSRSTIAGGLLENTPANLHRWITDPNGVKPGNKMYVGVSMGTPKMHNGERVGMSVMTGYKKAPDDNSVRDYTQWADNITVNDEEARALVAYLHSLK